MFQELVVQLVLRDQEETKVLKVILVLQVPQVPKVIEVPKELKVLKEQLVTLVLKEQ